MGFWWFFNAALLGAGILTLSFSIIWRRPDVIMNMVVDRTDLNFGLVLGGFLVGSWVLSVAAVIQRNHITKGLVYLNWFLIITMLLVLAYASFLWFDTLHELVNFHQAFAQQSPAARIFIQDKFQCCGYFSNTDLVEIGGNFCNNASFVAQSTSLCWSPISKKADSILNLIFSTVYGFIAIVGLFFLSTLCVINERITEERFKKIDAKRGGRGFV